MLPGASPERIRREVSKGSPSGRTHEIQRLIGRSLRGVCDMVALGERQVIVDCDVLQADGGTRTASITGGYVALHDALTRLVQAGVTRRPSAHRGLRGDLGRHRRRRCRCSTSPTSEDSAAEVDMNVVMTESGRFLEVQGTAEGMASAGASSTSMLGLAEAGITELIELQRAAAVRSAEPRRPRPLSPVRSWLVASRQPRQGGGDRRHPRACRCRAGTRARRRSPTWSRTRRHAGGQRPAEGRRHLRGDRLRGGRRRHRARGRCPRRCTRACARPASRARAPATPTTWPGCWPSSIGSAPPRRPTPGPLPHRARWSLARRERAGGRGRGRGPHREGRRGRRRGSGTTRCSCPTEGGGRTFAEMSAAEKHAREPPRPGVPGARRGLGAWPAGSGLAWTGTPGTPDPTRCGTIPPTGTGGRGPATRRPLSQLRAPCSSPTKCRRCPNPAAPGRRAGPGHRAHARGGSGVP